jgi:hypothetical protein
VADDKKTGTPSNESRRAVPAGGVTLKQVRTWAARVAWGACVLFAVVLAVGALLISLQKAGSNPDNGLYKLFVNGGDKLDLGALSRDNGLFSFDGKNAATKNALTNWGIAAVIWLVIGRVADRILRSRR